jgi:uncharacterized protein YcfJ
MKMYKRVLSVCGLLLLTTTASAETYTQHAIVRSVQNMYSSVNVQTPVNKCVNVNVPIYAATNEASIADVIAGALVGGLIGNQVGGGSGKDAATLIGAIAGADVANKKSTKKHIVGYQSQRQCSTTYTTKTIKQYDGSMVVAEYNQMRVTFKTNKIFSVGDYISVRVSVEF